jgi:hypothetical protein
VHGGRNKAGLGAVGALGLLPCGIQVARAVGHALLQGGGQTAQLARGFLVASDVGVAGHKAHAVIKRAQRLVGVLPGGVQLAAFLVVERLQQAVAPGILAGEKDHPMRVRRQHDVGRLQPFALQILQRDVDGQQPQRAAVFIAHGLRQEVAGSPVVTSMS